MTPLALVSCPAPSLRPVSRLNRLPDQPSVVRILVLGGDAAFADCVREDLGRVAWGTLSLEWVETLAAALTRLENGVVDCVITDLNVRDSQGLYTVEALARAGDRLIIVLTDDPAPGLREAAISRGA